MAVLLWVLWSTGGQRFSLPAGYKLSTFCSDISLYFFICAGRMSVVSYEVRRWKRRSTGR